VEHDYTTIQDDDMGEEDTVEIRGQGSPTMEELKLPAAPVKFSLTLLKHFQPFFADCTDNF